MSATLLHFSRGNLARLLTSMILSQGVLADTDTTQQLAFSELAAVNVAVFNAQPTDDGYRQELVGLFVDSQERDGLIALSKGTQFLLPLERVLAEIGATMGQQDGQVMISTPGGDAVLPLDSLVRSNGTLMVQMDALNDALKLQARFDSAAYAVLLSPPWSAARGQRSTHPSAVAQYSPPSASLRNMRADFNYFHSDTRSDTRGEYFAAGNLARGTWQTRILQDNDDEFTPFDYYWHRADTQSQILLGNSNYSLHPLLPGVEQTGAQGIYSNQGFVTDSSDSLTSAGATRDLSSGTRKISGVGEPGSIAQLRINGGVVARTRVRLDGTFEFNDSDLPTRGSAEISVLLLDRSSGVLIDTLDYSQRGSASLLSAGQHTVFAALGEEGNPLDDRFDSRGTSSAAQWRYGVNERVTLELGSQDNGRFTSNIAGASMSFAQHWFTSVAYAETDNTEAVELDLEGGQGRWRLDVNAREYRIDNENETRNRQWIRYGNYRYQVTDRLNLGLYGRDAKTRFEDEQFLLPAVNWNDGRYLSINATPNIAGDYRVDSRFTPTREDTVRYTYENDNHLVDYRHRTNYSTEYYANYRDGKTFDTRVEAGIIRYLDNPRFERVQLGLVAGGDDYGFVAQWDSRILPGVFSRLRVSDNAYSSDSFDIDPGLTVQWDLTLDFALSRGRVVPADTSFGNANSSAMTGTLMVNGENLASHHDVRRLVLIVGGISYTALVQGNQYYVDGLPPGLHRVSLDSRYLPIELVPAKNQGYWVDLQRSAATSVPVNLEARYAIAGRVRNGHGEPIPAAVLRISEVGGAVLSHVATDQFGFYRADNLAPGEYRVEVFRERSPVASRVVSITTDFLFDQDLVVE